MSDSLVQIHLVFVVESDVSAQTDRPYFVWLLNRSYSKYLRSSGYKGISLTYEFVYMGGKSKYKSKRVVDEIDLIKKMSPGEIIKIIYCIDIDTKGKEEKASFLEIQQYVKEKKYDLIASYKEIEDVTKSYTGGSKKGRVNYFIHHNPKYSIVSDSDLSVQIKDLKNKVGTSNFLIVVNKIIGTNMKRIT